MQLVACNAFVDILEKQLVPLQHYAQTFLRSIVAGLDNKDHGEKRDKSRESHKRLWLLPWLLCYYCRNSFTLSLIIIAPILSTFYLWLSWYPKSFASRLQGSQIYMFIGFYACLLVFFGYLIQMLQNLYKVLHICDCLFMVFTDYWNLNIGILNSWPLNEHLPPAFLKSRSIRFKI